MRDEKKVLQEGKGVKPQTARPGFAVPETAVLPGPSGGASVGFKPSTPRPGFPRPTQPQDSTERPAEPVPPAKDK